MNNVLYLGQTFIDLGTGDVDNDLTMAIRDFNLPNAVAPGAWPNLHEGVTTDEDPRHQG